MKRALGLLAMQCLCGLAFASQGALRTLTADLKQAWTQNSGSYHRFLSAAYGIARKAMDGQDWNTADVLLKQQGIKYKPEIDVQHVTTSDPIFQVKIGSLTHDVRLEWLIVTRTSPTEPTWHVIAVPEVQLTLNPKVPFDQFRRTSKYPAGTFMSRVLSDRTLAKKAETFPILNSLTITYSRMAPYISQEVEPDQGFLCQFECRVDLVRGEGSSGVTLASSSTSQLDPPLTLTGKPADPHFVPSDVLGDLETREWGSWSSSANTSFLIEATDRTQADEPNAAPIYSVGDLRSLSPTVTSITFREESNLSNHDLAMLARFRNLERLEIYWGEGNPNEPFNAGGLAVILKLKKLKALTVGGPGVTDAFLQQIDRLGQLQSLEINSSPITDKGLSRLPLLKHLSSLRIDHCHKITERATSTLAKLRRLQSLTLTWCGKITDPMLASIGKLRQLNDVTFAGPNSASASGWLAIGRMAKLRSIQLIEANADNRFLALIASSCPGLTSLTIRNDAAVTDRGVLALAKLKHLEWILFDSCPKVTRASMEKLKNLLPGQLALH